ncbi:MAG TPA: UDP-N-acetylglucosamine 1-carboxyvinyltransferase [Candidatus Polarisedimenticolia bacterium]|nr:UDP-N-acetylglucosamine 1-carboxyvinyltransferase [Candidatus Polarisedimenticolia bacterium]
MDRIRIRGGIPLEGTVAASGAKNAVLPALAACLLTGGMVELRRVPQVRDVRTMLRVLEHLGARTSFDPGEGVCRVEVRGVGEPEAPYDLVKTMRASVLVLGPLLARTGRARVSLPGGCAIGERPIHLHLEGLCRLGAGVDLEHGYITARSRRLRGADYTFPIKTVTGTENLLMAACLAEGRTVLRNCALEPEIADLARLLGRMGARIEGAGTETCTIDGVESLHGAEHDVLPDRIEAGTFLMAAAVTRGRVAVTGCVPEHLTSLAEALRRCGIPVSFPGPGVLAVSPWETLCSRDLATAPYPGFPTDLQAQYMALMTQATGTALITENIFENRFMHAGELRRMGASVTLDGRTAIVRGPTRLSGAPLMATDLRASASLILAALAAAGTSLIDRVYHLDRGYERIEEKLRSLGADIERLR